MPEENRYPELTKEELEEQSAELLPEREQMSVIQPITPIGGGHTVPVDTVPVEPTPTE
jgi:hypothetical protein